MNLRKIEERVRKLSANASGQYINTTKRKTLQMKRENEIQLKHNGTHWYAKGKNIQLQVEINMSQKLDETQFGNEVEAFFV